MLKDFSLTTKVPRYHTGTFLETAVWLTFGILLECRTGDISRVTCVKWVKVFVVAGSKQHLTSSALSEPKLALLCKIFDTTEHTGGYICSLSQASVNHYKHIHKPVYAICWSHVCLLYHGSVVWSWRNLLYITCCTCSDIRHARVLYSKGIIDTKVTEPSAG